MVHREARPRCCGRPPMYNRQSVEFSSELPPLAFPTPQHQQEFQRLVLNYFASRQRQAELCNEPYAVAEGEVMHGLYNLAQTCLQLPQAQWPQVIADHLDLNNVDELTLELQRLAGGHPQQILPRLRIRLHPQEFLGEDLQHEIVHRTDLVGLHSVLMLDLGPSYCAVPTPMAQSWGLPTPQLFAAAIANLRQLPLVRERRHLPGTPLDGIDTLRGEECVGSLVLTPELLPPPGPAGSLLALPRRSELLCWPLRHRRDLAAMESLAELAQFLFREGPGSLSPHLYWRRPDGRYERLQTSRQGNRVRLASTSGFAAACAALDQGV